MEDDELKEDIESYNKMTLSELHKQSIDLAGRILSRHPNTFKEVCKRSERLKFIKQKIKELKNG